MRYNEEPLRWPLQQCNWLITLSFRINRPMLSWLRSWESSQIVEISLPVPAAKEMTFWPWWMVCDIVILTEKSRWWSTVQRSAHMNILLYYRPAVSTCKYTAATSKPSSLAAFNLQMWAGVSGVVRWPTANWYSQHQITCGEPSYKLQYTVIVCFSFSSRYTVGLYQCVERVCGNS